MANQAPIDRFVIVLANPDGTRSLQELRERLDPARQGLRLSYQALGV